MAQDHTSGEREDEFTPGDEGRTKGKGPLPVGQIADEDRRPTPVRQVMESGVEETGGEEGELRTIRDPESGQKWIATVTGQSGSGILPVRSVPVMEVVFSHAENPGRPLRRAVEYDRALSGVSDPELLVILRGARPYTEPLTKPSAGDGEGRKRGRTRSSRRS
jgi:hypothetical protein